jgi:hypothetical protein
MGDSLGRHAHPRHGPTTFPCVPLAPPQSTTSQAAERDQWHCAAFLPGYPTLSAEEETEATLAAEKAERVKKRKPPRRGSDDQTATWSRTSTSVGSNRRTAFASTAGA